MKNALLIQHVLIFKNYLRLIQSLISFIFFKLVTQNEAAKRLK